ncbi:50S ribosomal protein L18 [Parcubacteria bacterium DG_74_2]|nr:MAG: 50S ribosomal protein L18 [Parcubacteria bacterium DG_74_2]
MLDKRKKRKIRHLRTRRKIKGTKNSPRLCVFRSSKHIYCQLIDDKERKTISAASDLELKEKNRKKMEIAKEVGKLIAKRAKKLKIEKIVFDSAGYRYHGRVKALAEGAREGGLKF